MAIVFNVDNICPMCGSYNHVLLFDGEVEGLVRYTNENKRVYLQEAFPQTEADVREFIKTGYCGKCQKKIFGYASGRIKAGEALIFNYTQSEVETREYAHQCDSDAMSLMAELGRDDVYMCTDSDYCDEDDIVARQGNVVAELLD